MTQKLGNIFSPKTQVKQSMNSTSSQIKTTTKKKALQSPAMNNNFVPSGSSVKKS